MEILPLSSQSVNSRLCVCVYIKRERVPRLERDLVLTSTSNSEEMHVVNVCLTD